MSSQGMSPLLCLTRARPVFHFSTEVLWKVPARPGFAVRPTPKGLEIPRPEAERSHGRLPQDRRSAEELSGLAAQESRGVSARHGEQAEGVSGHAGTTHAAAGLRSGREVGGATDHRQRLDAGAVEHGQSLGLYRRSSRFDQVTVAPCWQERVAGCYLFHFRTARRETRRFFKRQTDPILRIDPHGEPSDFQIGSRFGCKVVVAQGWPDLPDSFAAPR